MTDRRKRPAPAAQPSVRAALAGAEDRLLKLPEVIEIAKIGKTMIYRLMRQGAFPKCCQPGGRGSRWSEREVSAWIRDRLAGREAA